MMKVQNTPTGASTNPKNLDLSKNISTFTSDIALIFFVTKALILRISDSLLGLGLFRNMFHNRLA